MEIKIETKSIEELVAKAAATQDSNDAMKFSQAAANAANALYLVRTLKGGVPY